MNGRWIQLKMARTEGLGSPRGTSRGGGWPTAAAAPSRGTRESARGAGALGRSGGQPRPKAAFTLTELMVVLAIIGLLAALSTPMLKGLSQSNAIAAASRQLLDDLSLARLKAINNRTTVYVVFAPTNLIAHAATIRALTNDPRQMKLMTNLIAGQYSAYALLAQRTAGDQPGRPTPRYLTEWRTLPEGIFFAPAKYTPMTLANWARLEPTNRPFLYLTLPFPTATSPKLAVPCLAFNSLGQLVRPVPVPMPDEVIPLTKGSIMFTKDALGHNTFDPADFREVPPGNSVSAFHRVHLYWQTGRGRIEKLEVR